jgi:hypothetical protein
MSWSTPTVVKVRITTTTTKAISYSRYFFKTVVLLALHEIKLVRSSSRRVSTKHKQFGYDTRANRQNHDTDDPLVHVTREK